MKKFIVAFSVVACLIACNKKHQPIQTFEQQGAAQKNSQQDFTTFTYKQMVINVDVVTNDHHPYGFIIIRKIVNGNKLHTIIMSAPRYVEMVQRKIIPADNIDEETFRTAEAIVSAGVNSGSTSPTEKEVYDAAQKMFGKQYGEMLIKPYTEYFRK